LDLRIDYLHPATTGEAIRGTAECYKVTSNIAFVRGVAYHTDPADPIAQCTGAFMLGGMGLRSRSAPPVEGGGQPC
jgi:acyl-coenzyme A thioesterase PaaI-like protein